MPANSEAHRSRGGSGSTSGDSEVLEYLGYRIAVRQLVAEGPRREPLLIRVLAAASLWGLQEEVWEWTVCDGDRTLASDEELSRLAALEEARYWVREYAPPRTA